jgi:hypothetical protein
MFERRCGWFAWMKKGSSFLKKSSKKLLRVWPEPLRKGRSQNRQKFFASFFSKKKCFLPFLAVHATAKGSLALSNGHGRPAR